MGCVRQVLQAEGWQARSWQQDGLLVEEEGGRRLRGGGGGGEAKARLEVAMRNHQYIHCKSEKIALAKKAEAKDYKLRFLERENARLRRLLCCTPTYEACGTSVQANFGA